MWDSLPSLPSIVHDITHHHPPRLPPPRNQTSLTSLPSKNTHAVIKFFPSCLFSTICGPLWREQITWPTSHLYESPPWPRKLVPLYTLCIHWPEKPTRQSKSFYVNLQINICQTFFHQTVTVSGLSTASYTKLPLTYANVITGNGGMQWLVNFFCSVNARRPTKCTSSCMEKKKM